MEHSFAQKCEQSARLGTGQARKGREVLCVAKGSGTASHTSLTPVCFVRQTKRINQDSESNGQRGIIGGSWEGTKGLFAKAKAWCAENQSSFSSTRSNPRMSIVWTVVHWGILCSMFVKDLSERAIRIRNRNAVGYPKRQSEPIRR